MSWWVGARYRYPRDARAGIPYCKTEDGSVKDEGERGSSQGSPLFETWEMKPRKAPRVSRTRECATEDMVERASDRQPEEASEAAGGEAGGQGSDGQPDCWDNAAHAIDDDADMVDPDQDGEEEHGEHGKDQDDEPNASEGGEEGEEASAGGAGAARKPKPPPPDDKLWKGVIIYLDAEGGAVRIPKQNSRANSTKTLGELGFDKAVGARGVEMDEGPQDTGNARVHLASLCTRKMNTVGIYGASDCSSGAKAAWREWCHAEKGETLWGQASLKKRHGRVDLMCAPRRSNHTEVGRLLRPPRMPANTAVLHRRRWPSISWTGPTWP